MEAKNWKKHKFSFCHLCFLCSLASRLCLRLVYGFLRTLMHNTFFFHLSILFACLFVLLFDDNLNWIGHRCNMSLYLYFFSTIYLYFDATTENWKCWPPFVKISNFFFFWFLSVLDNGINGKREWKLYIKAVTENIDSTVNDTVNGKRRKEKQKERKIEYGMLKKHF